ncbi:hypothetical protein M0804_008624 [Polistes exclamans]|nr:hypothetical protein M0804_008624 [Polistes exclamans]
MSAFIDDAHTANSGLLVCARATRILFSGYTRGITSAPVNDDDDDDDDTTTTQQQRPRGSGRRRRRL